MKELLLILICLFSLNTLACASFPITENSPSDISNAISFQMADEEEGEDGVKWWLLIPFVVALGFGAYFLIRAVWRAWKKRKWWARKLLPLVILISLPAFLSPYGILISIPLLLLLGIVLLYKRLVA